MASVDLEGIEIGTVNGECEINRCGNKPGMLHL